MNIKNTKPKNAVYLLPNSVTTAAMLFGFYAIFKTMEGDLQTAATCVIIAALLDACDGRIARWTGTESKFGLEYDSLADVVSFGVTPALMLYQWQLHNLGGLGIGVAFVYCGATAIRLARFNCQIGQSDKRFFIGLPCPAAAVLTVSFIASMHTQDLQLPTTIAVVALLWIAGSMVVGIRFFSFKQFNFKHKPPFRYAILLLFFIAIVLNFFVQNPQYIMHLMFATMFAYLVSGYAFALISTLRRGA